MHINLPDNVNRVFSVKNVSYAAMLLNLVSIVFGIIYLAGASAYIFVISDIFGIIILVTIFCNLLLTYLNTSRLNKTTKLGNKLNLLCYIYLMFVIVAMFLIMLGNWLYTANYSNLLIDNLMAYGFLLLGYFGVLGFGMVIAFVDIKNLENKELWDLTVIGDFTQSNLIRLMKKLLKIFIGFICLIFLLLGVSFIYGLSFGGVELVAEVLASVSAVFGVFFAIIGLSSLIIFLSIWDRRMRPRLRKALAITGLVAIGALLLPLFATPYAISTADQNFAAAFGANWRDGIPADVENNYFMTTPFSLPGYFLNIPPEDCKIDKDIEYYNGENVSLCFDVYSLEGGGTGLPGNNSILIRIHGGGWHWGDKGQMMQVNKYFAAQGYVVYDIQYGLKRALQNGIMQLVDNFIPTPEDVVGDFNVTDQVRHIGIFCKYIANDSNPSSADDYGANLDSVLVSGNSAGGHLTTAVALGIASGNYTTYFGTNLTIRGFVPIYPGPPQWAEIDGLPELMDPEDYLINATSPPCCILQGSNDYLCVEETKNIKNNYEAVSNDNCAIVWLPLGGHACDLYFPSYYNEVMLYYMERFMYLCVNNLI